MKLNNFDLITFDLENKEHLTLLERTIKSNGSELISGDIKRFVEKNIWKKYKISYFTS